MQPACDDLLVPGDRFEHQRWIEIRDGRQGPHLGDERGEGVAIVGRQDPPGDSNFCGGEHPVRLLVRRPAER